MPNTTIEKYGQQLDFALIDEHTPRLKVAKSNALVEAQYQLTGKEHKLLLAAMAKIRKDQTELHEQVFMVHELADLLGLSISSAYSELRRISAGLMKKQVEVRNEETGSWVLYQWVSKAYCHDGQFGIRFSDDLKPFLIGLVGRFTMYQLGKVLKMRSNYSIRFYELFKQFEAFGTRTFSLDTKLTANKNWDDFSRVMGYDPKSYPRFSNVNQRVIKPGLKEVRELTEFKDVQVKLIKWKNKTIAITFNFRSVDTLDDIEEHPVFPDVVNLGVPKKQCREIFARYDDDRIMQNLALTKEAHRNHAIDNPATHFLHAVQENYANPPLPLDADVPAPSSIKTKVGVPDHPLYEFCATEQEFDRLVAAETALGKSFASYNDFHQYMLSRQSKLHS
jgi:plasmid replication initiation protein